MTQIRKKIQKRETKREEKKIIQNRKIIKIRTNTLNTMNKQEKKSVNSQFYY